MSANYGDTVPSLLVFGQGHGLCSHDTMVCLVIQRPNTKERGNVPNVIPGPDEMLKLNLME